MASGRVHIGLSGWSYPGWKDGFFRDVPRRLWLEHYATEFNSVEVNATFYRLLKPTTYTKWLSQTPDRFRFTAKGSRYITHVRRLKNPAEGLARQRDNLMALMPKLAVVLWQLPAQLPADLDLLDHFLVSLAAWPEARHAIEFRNQSWLSDDVATRLARAQIIAVQSDAPDWPLWDKVTTDTVYVRMHGHTRLYRSEYTPKALQRWADRIRHWCTEDRTVHVYFDNTDEGAAPVDARRLRELVGV